MDPAEISIRPLDESDIDDVIRLSDTLGLSPWSRADYLAELKRKDAFLSIAAVAGKTAGFLVARRVPGPRSETWEAELYNIGVSEQYQLEGIGTRLMNGLIKKCLQGHVREIWLEVRRKNIPAIMFYRGFGFIESGLRPNFYQDPQDDAVLMHLEMAKIEN